MEEDWKVRTYCECVESKMSDVVGCHIASCAICDGRIDYTFFLDGFVMVPLREVL